MVVVVVFTPAEYRRLQRVLDRVGMGWLLDGDTDKHSAKDRRRSPAVSPGAERDPDSCLAVAGRPQP